ncbi:MAG: tetraacyldisaccharide 4'-kinase [Chitinivibrionales bacterium]|nr:tetraacyldisaccharide 4'-kinase [Chitinivibrionales bacterium]
MARHTLRSGLGRKRQSCCRKERLRVSIQPFKKNFLTFIPGLLYRITVHLRNKAYDRLNVITHIVDRPVISVGSVTAGGSGKTPLALRIGEFIHAQGHQEIFLSRGYKRKYSKNVIVTPSMDASWEAIGDEPSLLRNRLPSAWLGIGKDRVKNAHALSAITPKNSVFILDDGFQHRKLHRDLDIIALPTGVEKENMIPFGFLREPLENSNRAQVICLIGTPEERELLQQTRDEIIKITKNSSVFMLYQAAEEWVNCQTGESSKKLPCKNPSLISGIARPERFILLVEKEGVKPVSISRFDDHHIFSAEQISGAIADNCDGIITTEKDSCRIKELNLVNCPAIWYLKIGLAFFNAAEEKNFNDLILTNL